MSPRLHTHTKRELRFPPLFHTSCLRDWTTHYVEMSFRCFMSSYEGSNNPELYVLTVGCMSSQTDSRLVLVAGPGSEISVRDWVSTGKTPPHNYMLAVNPAFYLSSFILLRDPQGRFRSNKLVNSWTVVSLASPSAISFQRTTVCPWTQNSPAECWMETSFNAFWNFCTNGDIVLAAWRASKTAYQKKY